MELFNGKSEMENIELARFDEICSLVKKMKVGKTLEFNNLLVFGDGNHGNYLDSKLLSVCVIVVIFLCINIAYYFCYIIDEKDGVEFFTVDNARIQGIIKNKDGVLHEDFLPVNQSVMELLDSFFCLDAYSR